MTDVATDTAAETEIAGDADEAPATAFDWKAGLPEGLRENAVVRRYNDLPALVEGFISAQSMVGADKVVVPGADADEAAWDAFYARLGRPESAADYQLEAPDNLPDGFDYSEETAARFKDWAHAAGLTPAQANKLHGAFVENVVEALGAAESAETAAIGEADRAIREAWGRDYDRNVELAGRAITVLGGEELLTSLTKAGVLTADGAVTDPVIAYAFAEAGKMLGEDMLAGEGGGALPSADAAKRELAQLDADPEHRKALLDEGHAGHRMALERRGRLFKLAYPDA